MRKQLIPFAILMFIAGTATAQESAVSLGYVRTEFGRNAANFAVDYAEKLEPKLDFFKANSRSLISFSPDIRILLGTGDAFNGIVAKYVGSIMAFAVKSVAGVDGVPDLSKIYHVFPVSLGMETNKECSYVNGMLEVGYMPMINTDRRVPEIVRSLVAGIFMQGGYRTIVDDSLNQAGSFNGRNRTEDVLVRAKFSAKYHPLIMFDKKDEFGAGLVCNFGVWYDVIENDFPYTLSGKLRLILKKDYSLDFKYEKNSGEPNFQSGEQWTSNISVDF
jgi:hypothetical protein